MRNASGEKGGNVGSAGGRGGSSGGAGGNSGSGGGNGGGTSRGTGMHAGSGTPPAPPVIRVNGLGRQLAATARRSKPLARPILNIARPGEPLPEPPVAASLRAHCPPVLDQDPIESCAAFAFTSALRFLHLRDGRDEPLSPLFSYYATRVLIEREQADDDSGCKADAVVEALETYGACLESAWPYDTSKLALTPPDEAFQDAAKRKLTKAYRVTTLRAIKLSIAAGSPVPVAFPVARSVGSGDDAVLSPAWRTGVFPVPTAPADDAPAGYAGGPVGRLDPPPPPAADPVVGYHFVLAIGYDDATGLVEIENSWGPTFGDSGYGFLSYAFFGPTQDTLIADPSVLAEDPWTLRFQADE